MRFLRHLAWLAVQIPIIGFFLWATYEDPQKHPPGMTLVVGIAVAAFVTGLLSAALDSRLARVLLRRGEPHESIAQSESRSALGRALADRAREVASRSSIDKSPR